MLFKDAVKILSEHFNVKINVYNTLDGLSFNHQMSFVQYKAFYSLCTKEIGIGPDFHNIDILIHEIAHFVGLSEYSLEELKSTKYFEGINGRNFEEACAVIATRIVLKDLGWETQDTIEEDRKVIKAYEIDEKTIRIAQIEGLRRSKLIIKALKQAQEQKKVA